VVVLNEDGTVHAVSLLQQTQALADALRTDAEIAAGRLIAAATAEADSIRLRVADLRAAIPALENDLSLRRSLGQRELAEAEGGLVQVRLEANRILEDATARAAQIGSMAEAQADEVMARTQADAELARSVILDQLNQRVKGQEAAEQQARVQLETEFNNRWAEWQAVLEQSRQEWDQEQAQARAEFEAQCAAEQAEWQAQVTQHVTEFRAAEGELEALRGQIVQERQAADVALFEHYQMAEEERDQLLAQASVAAAATRDEANQRLVEVEKSCVDRASKAELDAATYVSQAKSLITQARTDADTIKAKAKAQADQVIAETRAAVEAAQDDATALLAEAESQAESMFDQAQVKAATMTTNAQTEIDEAKARARAIVEEAEQQASKLRDDWAAQATEISQQSAERTAQMRAEAARLLTEARTEADAMREQARDMVEQARQETDQMAMWRDSVLREISSLNGVIESLVSPTQAPAPTVTTSRPATPKPTTRTATTPKAAPRLVQTSTPAAPTTSDVSDPGLPGRPVFRNTHRPPKPDLDQASFISSLLDDDDDDMDPSELTPSIAEFLAKWSGPQSARIAQKLSTETTNTEE